MGRISPCIFDQLGDKGQRFQLAAKCADAQFIIGLLLDPVGGYVGIQLAKPVTALFHLGAVCAGHDLDPPAIHPRICAVGIHPVALELGDSGFFIDLNFLRGKQFLTCLKSDGQANYIFQKN